LVLFFFVPIGLWLLGAVRSYRVGKVSPLLTIIIGSDNRLSLSRLQSFAWTLVIFGAFVAAMAVSNKLTAGTWVVIPRSCCNWPASRSRQSSYPA
jgi:hypothetical protein